MSPEPNSPQKISKITCENLSCIRSERVIFDHVSFAIQAGEMLAIRGANGIGKSTLLRIIAGLLSKKTGDITFHGLDDQEDAGRFIHYLGHKDPVKPGLTVREQLDFWAHFLDRPDSNFGSPLTPYQALKEVNLAQVIDIPGAYLSQGQRRRLSLARMLLVPRQIWLLDEPTAGLDAASEALFSELLKDHLSLCGVGILSTHLEIVDLKPVIGVLSKQGIEIKKPMGAHI